MMKSFQVIRTHLSPYQLQNFVEVERHKLQELPDISYKSLPEADIEQPTILITNTHTQLKNLPKELLERTELIIHPNSGYDHFNNEYALWKNIPLVIGHEIRAQAVAEYTLGCLFEGTLDLPQHLAWDKARSWRRTLIKNKNIWIFGYGHIGKIVSATLKSLGANITVIDPFISNCPHPHLKSWKDGDLSKAQVVLCCCSLNSSSFEMFNEDFFCSAHPELLFINGARGKLVKEKALREFLVSHPEAFAFLDVFQQEPFSEEWHHFPQVWKTSHIAGVHQGLDQDIIQFEVNTLKDFLSLDKPSFQKKYYQQLLLNKWLQGELI